MAFSWNAKLYSNSFDEIVLKGLAFGYIQDYLYVFVFSVLEFCEQAHPYFSIVYSIACLLLADLN